MTASGYQPKRFALFILLVLVFLSLGRVFHLDQHAIQQHLRQFGLLPSALIFIALYVGLTLFVWIGPKDVLRVVGAVLYGPYWSSLIVWCGEMGNALVMFSLSRRLGRGYVQNKIRGRWQQMDETMARTGFFSIFFIRFFPVVPFRFSDLAFGLTRVSLKKYILICAVGSPLRIFVIQFFLAVGLDTVMNPFKLQAYLSRHPHIYVLVMVYTLGSLGLIAFLSRKAKSKNATYNKETSAWKNEAIR